MAKKRLPPGVFVRGGMYWLEKRHKRLPGGRLRKTLECKVDEKGAAELVAERVQAYETLVKRGNWEAIEKWVAGDISVTDLVHVVVYDGDPKVLRGSKVPTLGEAIGWVEAELRVRSKGTQDAYNQVFKAMLGLFGRDLPLDAITSDMARDWLFSPQATNGGRPWSSSTVWNVCQKAARVWAVAQERDLEAGRDMSVPRNPFRTKMLRGLPKPQPRPVTLTREEWSKVLQKNLGTPQAAFLAMAYLAGLRLFEVVNLRREIDVDLERGWITIQPRGGVRHWKPKTENSVGSVPIGSTLRRVIEQHIELGFAGENYLFVVPGRDRPIARSTARDWWIQAYRRAGIEPGRDEEDGVVFHTGRHSFATWMAQDNISPLVIAELVRDTVQVVVDTYCHLVKEDLVFAVEGLEARMPALQLIPQDV